MHTLTRIVGHATDNETAHRLHDIEHHGVVHYILLNKQDTLRHRLRITTDKGTEVAIALPRSEQLTNGAVLMLGTDCAIVVRIQETTWLKLRARDNAAALELGYFAGNMHWKVKFDDSILNIAVEGPEQSYLDRLQPLLSSGKAVRVDG
ncbi:MAG: urease accessory protein UreE [Burkholderiales bacterium]